MRILVFWVRVFKCLCQHVPEHIIAFKTTFFRATSHAPWSLYCYITISIDDEQKPQRTRRPCVIIYGYIVIHIVCAIRSRLVLKYRRNCMYVPQVRKYCCTCIVSVIRLLNRYFAHSVFCDRRPCLRRPGDDRLTIYLFIFLSTILYNN